MKPTYIDDVPLPELWPGEAHLDPMHPEHGPLPHLAGLIKSKGERFFAALWDTGTTLVVFLEMLKEEDTSPEAPLLSLEECYHCRGWICQTYRWTLEENRFVCDGRKVQMPAFPGQEKEEEWMKEAYRRVMVESVLEATESRPDFMR